MWFLINGILSKSVADGLLSGSLDNILKFQQLKFFIMFIDIHVCMVKIKQQ